MSGLRRILIPLSLFLLCILGVYLTGLAACDGARLADSQYVRLCSENTLSNMDRVLVDKNMLGDKDGERPVDPQIVAATINLSKAIPLIPGTILTSPRQFAPKVSIIIFQSALNL